MRTRMYGGVRGRKTKVGGKPTFVFLLLDSNRQTKQSFLLYLQVSCKLKEYEKTYLSVNCNGFLSDFLSGNCRYW